MDLLADDILFDFQTFVNSSDGPKLRSLFSQNARIQVDERVLELNDFVAVMTNHEDVADTTRSTVRKTEPADPNRNNYTAVMMLKEGFNSTIPSILIGADILVLKDAEGKLKSKFESMVMVTKIDQQAANTTPPED